MTSLCERGVGLGEGDSAPGQGAVGVLLLSLEANPQNLLIKEPANSEPESGPRRFCNVRFAQGVTIG